MDQFPAKVDPTTEVVTVSDVKGLCRTFDHSENGYVDLTYFKHVTIALGFPFDNDKHALTEFKKLDTNNGERVSDADFMNW